jgi:very-short-patch-repair endonuclease
MPGVVIHRVGPLPAVDLTTLDGIPVTSPARTLIDIAAVAPRESVEEALDDALRRGIVSVARLRWRLSELGNSGRRGVGTIRDLIAARGGGEPVPKSVFETRLLRHLRAAGLPIPVRQHEIRVRGRLVARVDFAYPERRLAIEADSRRWHTGRVRWERDLARRNELTALGWRIVHVTWSELSSDPEGVARRIGEILRT